jgi:methyl-accepting chemotaxis protein
MLLKIEEPHSYVHIHAEDIQLLIEAGDLQEARSYLNNQIIPRATEVIGILNEMVYRYYELANEQTDRTIVFENIIFVIIVVLLVVAVVMGVIVSIFIVRGIENTLKDIIGKLSHSTGNINASASQLSEASDNLASGSSRQAAAIEQTSATMTQTAAMVEQNAESTRIAAELAAEATAGAKEAGENITELISTMGELKESSDRVSRIIKTIDDIAFQTNLLAINATVEAARAGDAGRSFGVVAEAVRDLALQSADAAANTTEIIDKNLTLTNLSRNAAEKVLQLAERDSQNTSKLGKLIGDINAASEEQARGIKEITMAISQMETVTQENAAVAEETSAAGHSMTDELVNLEDAVHLAESLVAVKR